MRRPSFQFYPGDWQANSNLRRCSHAEKGAWTDVMCLMHDQEEYGVLRWPLKEIAQAVGAPVALVKGLVTKGVLKGSDTRLEEAFIYTPRSGRKDGEPVTLMAPQDGPVWYSSRMVKDEHVRTVRGDGTRFGDADGASPIDARKRSPNPPLGDGPSSSSSSSSSREGERTLDGSTSGMEAGAACRALKSAGVVGINTSHPQLLRLVAAGVTPSEFADAAAEAKVKKFAYVLQMVEGRRNDAAARGAVAAGGGDPDDWTRNAA